MGEDVSGSPEGGGVGEVEPGGPLDAVATKVALLVEDLAQAAGVSRQSINSIERNRYVPSLELALTFARLFGCSTDQIFQLEIQQESKQ